MRQTQLDDSSQVTGNKDGVEFLTQNRIDIQNIQRANESIQATLRTFEEKFIALNGELGKTNQELQKTNDMNKSLLQMNAGRPLGHTYIGSRPGSMQPVKDAA